MMPTAWGVFAATGCVTTVLCLERRREAMGLTENEFWISIWTLVLGALAGAKLLFVVLGWPHYARGELRLWADFDTGFVFFGGLIGALGAGLLFARLRRLDFSRGADYFAVAVPLGHAIGRVGCFIEGCCSGIPPHPVQLYEAAGLLCIAWFGRRAIERVERGDWIPGSALRVYLAAYALLRFALDPLRVDGRPERYFGLSYPQGIALAVLLGVYLWHRVSAPLVAITHRAPREPALGSQR
jgi:phosphatidylglycerol:prolipoprotein diacylglycerol transferase